jgi:hypothetical protein
LLPSRARGGRARGAVRGTAPLEFPGN